MDTPYAGEENLILGLDIGIRDTSATVTHLVPGTRPKIRRVSRWPHQINSSKIPTAIFYSRDGIPQSFGAATLEDWAEEEAADWTLCRHFSLWLSRPLTQGIDMSTPYEVPPLPEGVTLEQVYTDWIGYLFRSIKNWWIEISLDGAHFWNRMERKIAFCIARSDRHSHPDLDLIRRALARATHSPELARGAQSDRVIFVSESISKLCYGVQCAPQTSMNEWLWDGAQIAVVDAGDSVVTTSMFEIARGFRITELKSPSSVQAGFIFPSRAMMAILKEKLRGSRYDDQETLNAILEIFDSRTKMDHRNAEGGPHVLKFGYDKDSAPEVDIRRGRLTLYGTEVARAFKPSLDAICGSIALQIRNTNVKAIMLCGTFGESPALQYSLSMNFPDVKVITSDEPPSRAVADGIVMSYLGPSQVVLDALHRSSRNLSGTSRSTGARVPDATATSQPRETHQK